MLALPNPPIPLALPAPTPHPTPSTSHGSSCLLLHSPINSMNLMGHSMVPCAIPIYAVDLQSPEAVGALMKSPEIRTALRQYGGIQLRQTPPMPEWGRPEETLNRVREFLHDSPSFGPHGQYTDSLRNSNLTFTAST